MEGRIIMATTKSLAEKAYQQLKYKLIYGELLPGEVLSENRLSQEMDMSRTPIRDALSRLASDGFIVTLKNRGILVKDISYKELLDIQALNHSMQNYAFELAADGVITFDIDKLNFHLIQQLEATSREDYIEYANQSILFGRAIIEAANNQTMVEVYDTQRIKTLRFAIVNWKLSPNAKHYSANNFNKEIFEAIEAEAYDTIKSIINSYVAATRKRFIQSGILLM